MYEHLESLAPFAAVVVAVVVTTVLAVNVLGKKLDRHDDWLRLLETRIGNLHKQRQASWVKKLQHPAELVPPPLPPRVPTIDATDWVDDDLTTEELMKKATGKYPAGEPPKGES